MMSLVPAQVAATLCSVVRSKLGTSSRYASLIAFEDKTLISAACAIVVTVRTPRAPSIAVRIGFAATIVLPGLLRDSCLLLRPTADRHSPALMPASLITGSHLYISFLTTRPSPSGFGP